MAALHAVNSSLEQARIQQEEYERQGRCTNELLQFIHYLKEQKVNLENTFLANYHIVQGVTAEL